MKPLDFELRSQGSLQNDTHEFCSLSLQKAMKAGSKVPGAYLQHAKKRKKGHVLCGFPNTLLATQFQGLQSPWLAEEQLNTCMKMHDWDNGILIEIWF